MQKQILTGKIHTARLTMCDLAYEGSMAIDLAYLRRANILPYEKILVVNRSNGERLETYAIPAKAGSKMFCLNGPAALKGKVGDVVTVMAFSLCDAAEAAMVEPKVIVLDANNDIVLEKGRIPESDMLG
ncbi:MAG: aspartate 1-decarboxylase [Victivallaceae bacterium]|nr:aspartate 1-decarboxylase [Victivallaceae bacterium]